MKDSLEACSSESGGPKVIPVGQAAAFQRENGGLLDRPCLTYKTAQSTQLAGMIRFVKL